MRPTTPQKLEKALPQVVLAGRTNVGKSTLFNRLTGKNAALTSKIAGTTRDYQSEIIEWGKKAFILTDTGGLDIDPSSDIEQQIKTKAEKALGSASLILLVVDAKDGLNPLDEEIYHLLKKKNKPIILVVTKADNPKKWEELISEFSSLGTEEIVPVSGISGRGSGDLLDKIINHLPPASRSLPTNSIKVAIVGRPNVGKSSLINAMLNEDKQIVSPIPHTTRDAQDIHVIYADQPITLIDTAGIRRKKDKGDMLEKFSINQALQKLQQADVTLFVIDISQPLTFQDKRLAAAIKRTNSSLIIIANKWDLIPDKDQKTINIYEDYVRKFMPHLNWAPIIFTSSTTKKNTNKIWPLIISLYQERFIQIPPDKLELCLQKIVKQHPPTRGKGSAKPQLLGIEQIDVNPPTLAVKIKYKKSLHSSYIKFIVKNIQTEFALQGTPVVVYIKALK